jgi:hypothetical protein
MAGKTDTFVLDFENSADDIEKGLERQHGGSSEGGIRH